MRRVYKRLIASVIALGALAVPLASAHAQTPTSFEPYNVERFNVVYEVEDTPQAQADVTERIDVRFSVQRHGIFRVLPDVYDRGPFKPGVDLNIEDVSVTNLQGRLHPFDMYGENDNLVLKIGDPNAYVIGAHTYVVKYSMSNFVRFYENHDEMFMDVNGTGWDTSFGSVNAKILLPTGREAKEVVCYTGESGSQDRDCTTQVSKDGKTVSVATTSPLAAYSNLSFAIKFDSGSFAQPSAFSQWSGVVLRNIGILLPLGIGVLAYRKWRRSGKDPAGRGVIVPEYDPPAGLTPGEVGTLIDFSPDNTELTGTLIDLAIRGWIRINDLTESERKKKRDYEFELLNADFTKLKPHEESLLEGLFEKEVVGEKVALKDLKNKFYTTAGEMKKQLTAALTSGGYFSKKPAHARGETMTLGGLLAVVGFISLVATEANWFGWSIGLIISGIILLIIGWYMPQRTHKGVIATEAALGLKLFMEVAEAERIKILQGPDSEYLGDKKAPKFTVHLYEKLLPFAIVMGVEKAWSEKFKDIYKEPPTWYNGNWSTFNAIYLADRLSNGVGQMSTVMTSSPTSSSGSGFSGGSSGGGFGGGGGGSW